MTIFAKHDFADGTLGPFAISGVQGIVTVKPDPTAILGGNVCAIHYETFPEGGNFDCNQAISPINNPGRKLGEEVWIGWKFYLDTDALEPAIRKFTYWGWSNDVWGFQHQFNLVLSSANSQLPPIPPNSPLQWLLSSSYSDADGTHQGAFGAQGNAGPGTFYGPANITTKVWHKVKQQLRLESAFGAGDGILRLWFNDVLIFESTTMRWTSPTWTDDPAIYQWVDYRVGQQVNGSAKFIEDRYLKDICYSDQEADLFGEGGSGSPALNHLVVSPSSIAVEEGLTTSVTVAALDQFGNAFALPALTLHTANGNITLDPPVGNSITVHGVAAGTSSLWVTSGAVESNHVSVNVGAAPGALATLLLGPNSISTTINKIAEATLLARDAQGNEIAPPLVTFFTSNPDVANFTTQGGNRLTIEAHEAGVALLWVGSGSILSQKITILCSDPSGGKSHRHNHP